jgi:hypothetical protein
MNDVALVCRNCHEEIHARVKSGNVSLWDATKSQGSFYFRATKPAKRRKRKKKRRALDNELRKD